MKRILVEKRILKFECDCGCDFETNEYHFIKGEFKKGYLFKTRDKQISVCPKCNKEVLY